MKISIAFGGLSSRLGRAHTERMRTDAVSAALRELARRATPRTSDVPFPPPAAIRSDPEETRS